MIQEAMEYLLGLGRSSVDAKITYWDGIPIARNSAGDIYVVPGAEQQTFEVSTLGGIVALSNKYMQGMVEHSVFVHNWNDVRIYRTSPRKTNGEFSCLAKAWPASNNDSQPQMQTFSVEQFVMHLLTRFNQSEQRDELLKMVSNVTSEAAKTATDDGFSQQVVTKVSAARFETKNVKNPVYLSPRRSFSEVELAPCAFVVRFNMSEKDGGKVVVTLEEASGQEWKTNAIIAIADYLKRCGVNNVIA